MASSTFGFVENINRSTQPFRIEILSLKGQLPLMWLLAAFFLITFMSPNAQAQVMEESRLKSREIEERKYPQVMEVRYGLPGGFINIRQGPGTNYQTVLQIPEGSILTVDANVSEAEKRDELIDQDKGTWRKSRVLSEKERYFYFYDYWKYMESIHNSSYGVMLERTPEARKKPLALFMGQPRSLNVKCGTPELQCLPDPDRELEIYLAKSEFVEFDSNSSGAPAYALMYQVRILSRKNEVLHDGWVLASEFVRRIDEYSCNKTKCLSKELIINDPITTREFFYELGLSERPKVKKHKVTEQQYLLGGLVSKNKKPFNRWTDRLERKKKEFEGLDEIQYLFKLRPLFEAYAGGMVFEYRESGDNGNFKYAGVGPGIGGSAVLPLFLDLELQVLGEFGLPVKVESKGIDFMAPLELTNDIMISLPHPSKQMVLYTGPGFTYRSVFTSNGDRGFDPIFGFHWAVGMLTPDFYGSMYYGMSGRDFENKDGDFEFGLIAGKFWIDDNNSRWGWGAKVNAYTYSQTETDSITGDETDTFYQGYRGFGFIQYEF